MVVLVLVLVLLVLPVLAPLLPLVLLLLLPLVVQLTADHPMPRAQVSTKHGNVNTNHMLFIASGAFHSVKPSDLMPELQAGDDSPLGGTPGKV